MTTEERSAVDEVLNASAINYYSVSFADVAIIGFSGQPHTGDSLAESGEITLSVANLAANQTVEGATDRWNNGNDDTRSLQKFAGHLCAYAGAAMARACM